MGGVGGASGVPLAVDQENAKRFRVRLSQQVSSGDRATEACPDDRDATGGVCHDVPSQAPEAWNQTSEPPISSG